jgi:hypothetical protein
MKIIKKFTAVQISTKKVDNTVVPDFEYGKITGPYYDVTTPKTQFDTEQEAIEWAHKEDSFADWLILPLISFENY